MKAEDFQRAAVREAENLKRQQIVEARDQILKEKRRRIPISARARDRSPSASAI
jgi:hypothetical protein